MSDQRSGCFMYPDLKHWLKRDPEGLSTIDNEIRLEKTYFDFSPEGNFL